MALKFEFVQHGEFSVPQWRVIDHSGDEDPLGWFIYYEPDGWLFAASEQWDLDAETLIQIAFKLEIINRETKSQRILGVF